MRNEQDTDNRQEFVAQQKMKMKVLVRRGSAYCQLGMFGEAKADYGFVLSMSPQQPELQEDFARISLLQQGSNLKEDGDALCMEGKHQEAIDAYSRALELDPCYISCYTNRATCFLATGNSKAAIEDCSRALEILEVL